MKIAFIDYISRQILPAVDPGAAGWYTLSTIAPDEFWELFTLRVVCSTAGTTAGSLPILDPETLLQNAIKAPTAAQTQLYEFNPIIPLKQTAILQVNLATYNALDTILANAYYRLTKFQK